MEPFALLKMMGIFVTGGITGRIVLCRRSGERKSDHFLRRHVRRGKYFSACKRAHCPPKADSACVAVRPQTPLSKK